jgi:hypothetical protein
MSNINIDYTNLKEFVKFINGIGGYENKKYENSYAIRGGTSYDSSLPTTTTDSQVNLADFNALLNYISGADTNTVIGNECNITTSCEYLVNSDGTLNTIVPPQRNINWLDDDLYSKCYYEHIDGSKTDIIKDDTIVTNVTNNPDCDSSNKCPTDVYYSWDTNVSYNSTLPGQFWPYDDERSRPGKCVKKYGKKPSDTALYTTDIVNDPNIASGATIDINGKYECKSVGTKLGESPDGAIISDSSTNQIARECNDATDIWYDGDTREHRKGALGLNNLTQDCVIKQTNAHYVTKNFADRIENNDNITRADLDNNNNICESHMPLYVEDSGERAKYDVPHANGEGPEDWWDNNTCTWINEIPLVQNGSWLQGNEIRFLPPQFNGECKIDEVANLGSGEYVGSSGSGIVNSDGSDRNISAIIKPSQMNRIKNEGLFNYASNNTDFYPGVNYMDPVDSTDYTNDIDTGNNVQCKWLSDSNITYNQSNNNNPMISALPNPTDANDTDANGILYSNNIKADHSTPIYYRKDASGEGSNSRLVLNNTDNTPNTSMYRQISSCTPSDKANGSITFNGQTNNKAKWYQTDEINSNSTIVPDTSDKLYYASSDLSIQEQGYGSGKCLVHMEVTQPSRSHIINNDSAANYMKNLEYQTGLSSNNLKNKLRKNPSNNNILPAGNESDFYYSIPGSACNQRLDNSTIGSDGSLNVPGNSTEDSKVILEYAWIKPS